MKILGYDVKTLVLLMATGIGAYGGFPTPPPIFEKLKSKYQIVPWLLLFVLLYQGGAGQDIKLAGMGVIVIFILDRILSMDRFNKKDE